jgi:hypothetical protein
MRPAPAPRRALRRPVLTAGLLALSCAAIAGCGSGQSSGTSADPAGVVPAGAPIYLGAEVRPQGGEKTAAQAVGQALAHQPDPYARLVAILQTPGSPALSFSHDVAPWLGQRGGVFLTSLSGAGALLAPLEQGLLGGSAGTASFPFGSSGAQGAIVLDTSDSAKANTFLSQQASHAGAKPTSYRGVSYEQSTGGVAFALVDRFAVIGSATGVRDVIETAQGGAPLSHSSGYSTLLAAAPAGALAHLYSNPLAGHEASPGAAGTSSGAGTSTSPGTSTGAATSTGPSTSTTAAKAGASGASASVSSDPLAALAGARQANISLVPSASSLALYVDAHTSASAALPGGLLASSAEGARALEELPGESWLAAGLGNLGQTLSGDAGALGELGALLAGLGGSGAGATASGTLSVGGLLSGLISPLAAMGADTPKARQDFASWMGSGGVYAGGSGLLELRGAIVIESRNPARSQAAVGELAEQLAHAGDATQKITVPGTDAAVSVRVPGLPLMLVIANGKDQSGATKFVLGLGEASVTTALHPTSTMASSPARTAAASSLGEGISPSVVFEVQTLVGLLEAVGLTEDPTLSKVLPYARAITTVAGGGHSLPNEIERYKLVAGLRQSGG